MKNIQKKLLPMIICLALTLILLGVSVYADMGPKPSVRVNFEGLGDEPCFATLLSAHNSTGPASAWDGTAEHARHSENEAYSYADIDYEIWEAFVSYKDADGYYFLQEAWQVNETKALAWTYYPPSPFKVLLYFPESDTFAVSGICERYAFDSYFTVNVEDMLTASTLATTTSYDYTWETISLAARIVLTVLIEVLIGLLLGFKKKRELIMLIATNAVTQIALNVALNVINYRSGQLAFVFFYVLFELLVFAIEATVYCALIKKVSDGDKGYARCILYALTANAVSFAAGFVLATVIPGIF